MNLDLSTKPKDIIEKIKDLENRNFSLDKKYSREEREAFAAALARSDQSNNQKENWDKWSPVPIIYTLISDECDYSLDYLLTSDSFFKQYFNMFNIKVEDLPLYINDEDFLKRVIANWRLDLGK